MSEAKMWESIRPKLKEVDPVRVENVVGIGTPDVNYNNGWIELKYLAKWPAREQTPVTIDHFTPQQRTWLLRRHRKGGNAFLLLKVGKTDWLLFDGETAARHVGKVPKSRMIELAVAYWSKLPSNKEIQKWLV